MRLLAGRFDRWRTYSVEHFGWRRLARYHLGRQLLRLAKQTDQAFQPAAAFLYRPEWITQAHDWIRRHDLHRHARTAGGLEGLVFASGLTLAVSCHFLFHPRATQVPHQPTLVASVVSSSAEANRAIETDPAPGLVGSIIEPVKVELNPASRLKVEYALAREQCIAKLAKTDAYQSASREIVELQKEVDALRTNDPHGDLPGVSLRWIRTKSLLTGMIQSAVAADPDVRRAESAMRAGGLIQPTFPIRADMRAEEMSASSQTAASD